jgi:nitrite reductase (NADH) small subunit/3-phenylpropionate/trans-cinnamate dioxygenase ferredoxin subunit
MSELRYVTVAQVGTIPEGSGRAFAVEGRMIAVFCQGGEYFAIDDVCPHMGASLAEGYVEEGVVTCPWHAWRFRVCDGTWCDNPRIKIDRFPVRIEGDTIQVGIGPPRSSAPPGNQGG